MSKDLRIFQLSLKIFNRIYSAIERLCYVKKINTFWLKYSSFCLVPVFYLGLAQYVFFFYSLLSQINIYIYVIIDNCNNLQGLPDNSWRWIEDMACFTLDSSTNFIQVFFHHWIYFYRLKLIKKNKFSCLYYRQRNIMWY